MGTDAGGIFGVAHEDAGQVLETLERVRHDTRSARHGFWFPLVLFGAVILGALPFYYFSIGQFNEAITNSGGGRPSLLDRFGFGAGASMHAWGAALFWLISIPAAYILVAAFYRIRARRTGVQGRVWPFVVTGLVLFLLLLVTAPGVVYLLNAPTWFVSWQGQIGDLYARGLTPILVIALALFVLARLERSWAMLWISVLFLPIALLANLYNISNAFYRIHHWIVPDWAANIAVAGGFLIFVGLVSLIGSQIRGVRHGTSG
jgi:hypothetical protein